MPRVTPPATNPHPRHSRRTARPIAALAQCRYTGAPRHAANPAPLFCLCAAPATARAARNSGPRWPCRQQAIVRDGAARRLTAPDSPARQPSPDALAAMWGRPSAKYWRPPALLFACARSTPFQWRAVPREDPAIRAPPLKRLAPPLAVARAATQFRRASACTSALVIVRQPADGRAAPACRAAAPDLALAPTREPQTGK